MFGAGDLIEFTGSYRGWSKGDVVVFERYAPLDEEEMIGEKALFFRDAQGTRQYAFSRRFQAISVEPDETESFFV